MWIIITPTLREEKFYSWKRALFVYKICVKCEGSFVIVVKEYFHVKTKSINKFASSNMENH